MKKEIAVKEKSNLQLKSPAELIVEVSKGNTNIGNLKELLEIQRDWERDQARKAFNLSMVNVQEKIPIVTKNELNPQTHSKYAGLDMIINKTKSIYTKEGFSITFYEGFDAPTEHVRICADVVHKLGHKETYHYDMPLDGVGIKGSVMMTKIHGKSSSVSYGRRYLMCMIWNIPTGDDDGNGAGKPVVYIEDKELNILRDLLASKDLKEGALCKVLKIESLEFLLKDQYTKAELMIKGAVKK